MGIFGSSFGLVIKGSSSSFGEYRDFLVCVCVGVVGGGGGSRVFQCKSNTKQWAYLAAVLVLSSKVLQAALVSTGIFFVCVCVWGGGGGGGLKSLPV